MVCSTDVSKPDMTHKTGIQVSSPSYPSALIFLELMKKEYEVERDRKKALEVRLGRGCPKFWTDCQAKCNTSSKWTSYGEAVPNSV